METQKAVLLIVGVLVAGLIIGSIFSDGAGLTGDAMRRKKYDGYFTSCDCDKTGEKKYSCNLDPSDTGYVTCQGKTYYCQSGWHCYAP
jgi:hypothetical protein